MSSWRTWLVVIGFPLLLAGILFGLSPGLGVEVTASTKPRPNIDPPPAPSPEKDPRTKALTMAEAVTLAERIGKGQATKAERKEKPEANFTVEVLGLDGVKTRVELSADGRVLTGKKGDDRREKK